MSQLIENCDHWHLCELADRWDGSIVSVAVLRRDLVSAQITAYLNYRSLIAGVPGQTDHNFANYLRQLCERGQRRYRRREVCVLSQCVLTTYCR